MQPVLALQSFLPYPHGPQPWPFPFALTLTMSSLGPWCPHRAQHHELCIHLACWPQPGCGACITHGQHTLGAHLLHIIFPQKVPILSGSLSCPHTR